MAITLENGQSESVTLALNAGQQYSIVIPSGAESLVITLSDLTGDLDLYVRIGVEATDSDWDYQSSDSGLATETVTVANPTAGIWFIFVQGYAAGSGVILAEFVAAESVPPIDGIGTIYAPVVAFSFVPTIQGVGLISMNPAQSSAVIPAVAMVGYIQRPSSVWALPVDDMPAAQTIYTLTLTGFSNGLADITIPMESFQTRLNEGGVHYLSAVIPNSRRWAADIAARNLGQWIVRKGYRMRDGSESLTELARVNFTSLVWSKGSTGDAATIYGSATVPVLASKSVGVTGVQYESLDTSGKRRVRCDVSKDLAPGDWCLWPGGSMQVGGIVHYVGAKMGFMEVSES